MVVPNSKFQRGLTLATTILALALALVLALALSSASLTHLHQSNKAMHQRLAQNAAEAALAQACERIVSQPDFGILAEPQENLELQFPESEARLSFHQDTADNWDVPVSTSNRFGLETKTGWEGTLIPPHSVQLFAVGSAGGTQAVIEMLVGAPEFPYVVASSGPVQSRGSLVIGTTNSVMDALQTDKLRTTALVSNGSVDISGPARVRGNVESASTVNVSPEVVVRGELRPNTRPTSFEDLDIPSMKPHTSIPLPLSVSPDLTGRFHHNGPQLVITGGLSLDNGVLYVNGDTLIRGGIRGKGAVIANGNLTVEGSSSLLATTQVALVAQKDLRVVGSAQDSSFFQGLIYTEGDFYAEDVTLVGAFLANRPSGSTEPGSRVQLENASLIQLPEYSKFDLDAIPFLVWENGRRQAQGGRETLYLLEVDQQDLQVLRDAVKVDRQGGSPNEGNPKMNVSVDMQSMLQVTRGRKATIENGELVSDWTEIDAQELTSVLGWTQRTGTDLPADGGFRPGPEHGLLNYEADPNSIYWKFVHSSVHLDLNEFMGVADRIRRVSWRKL